MNVRRGAATLAAAAMAATPATAASAQPKMRPTPAQGSFNFQRRALKMAELLWGLPRGSLKVSWDERPPGEEGTGWADKGDNTIHLAADQRPTLRYWEPLATTIMHEAGHVAGRGHTERGLMSPDRVYGITEGRSKPPPRRAGENDVVTGSAEDAWETYVTGGNWRTRRGGRPWLRHKLAQQAQR